jgi:GntR family transcriptional regulator of vanillate catabolism
VSDELTKTGIRANRQRHAVEKTVPLRAVPAGPTTRSQSVTDTLREAILKGDFGPGERVQEVPLSERLRVSRTPVRAALQSLAAEGMLEYSANRGYSVRRLRPAELLATFDIRGALEGLACRIAAEHGLSDEDRVLFERALEDGDRIVGRTRMGPREFESYRRVNVTIHDTIIRAAGTRMIGEMIRLCHNVPMSSNRNIVWGTPQSLARRHDDHHRIFDALIRREPARAEQLMREHIHCVKLQLQQRLGDGLDVTAD